MTRPLDPAALLDHRDFMRALARSLLGDEHRAEDVVQEACLAALVRPPRSEQALRPWLARVVRNLASNTLRGENRRADRELRVARQEQDVPTAHEIVERVTIQQEVGEALLAIGEAYRTAIYLRFHEGLPPRAIAARLGVPVETVRSRVRRGLAAMRERLDRAHDGERRAWSLALLPLAIELDAPPVPTLPPGALVAAAGALALALIGGLALTDTDAGIRSSYERMALTPLARQIVPDTRASLRVPLRSTSGGERARVAASVGEPVTGRVIDAFTGEPVAGITVGLEAADGERYETLTDADGRFATSVVFTPGRLLADFADAGVRVCGRAQQLLHDGRRSHELAVLIGPTFTVEAEPPQGLSRQALVCALLEGDQAVTTQLRGDPATDRTWVRFARRPELSSLAGGTRSRMRLQLASDDGRWADEVELPARPGVHATPIHFELRPCEPQAPGEPMQVGSVTGTLASITDAHVPVGSVTLTDGQRTYRAEPAVTASGEITFQLHGVPRGTYELFPPMDDGLPWDPPGMSVSVPAQGLVLTCLDDVPARDLRVEAYDRETGEPIAELMACVFVDRYRLGKETALERGFDLRTRPLAFGESATRVPLGTPVFWLVECPGFASARGDDSDLRSTPDGWLLRVRLVRAWRADLTIGHKECGRFTPLEGARLVTVGGSVLGVSDAGGHVYLELTYDPGRLRLELVGWRVHRWQGFHDGRLSEPGGRQTAWMVRD